jgi:hypothetical protein
VAGQLSADDQRAREILLENGATFAWRYPKSKAGPADAQFRSRLPKPTNAAVQVPESMIIFDADDEESVAAARVFLAEEAATLETHTPDGLHLYYQLPNGVRIGNEIGFGVKFDVLHTVMAPGSVVAGRRYVARPRPVATLSLGLATLLQEEVPPPGPAPGEVWIVQEAYAEYDPDAIVQAARLAAHRNDGRSAAGALAYCYQQAQHGEQGGRSQRIFGIARLFHELGMTEDELFQFLSEQPIGSRLREEGRGARGYLARIWRKIESQPVRWTIRDLPALDEAAARARYGQPTLAESWRAAALSAVAPLASTEHNLLQHARMVNLHASWAARYGVPYYLSHRTAATWLGSRGGAQRARAVLFEAGVVQSLQAGSVKRGAEIYMPIMPSENSLSRTPLYVPGSVRADLQDDEELLSARVSRLRPLPLALVEDTLSEALVTPLLSDLEIVTLRKATRQAHRDEHEGRRRKAEA